MDRSVRTAGIGRCRHAAIPPVAQRESPGPLPELGFCGKGEANEFIAGGAIEIGGRLPINTHGGELGEAYIHGMNGIAEGVRQLRGTSVNQVDNVEHVLVTAGTGVPTSGLILG
jgi:acetyl-CoA acetyltransferase